MSHMILVRGDSVVEDALRGTSVSTTAEPAYWSQFTIRAWNENTQGPPPRAGDVYNLASNTFAKSAERLAIESDEASDAARRATALSEQAQMETIAATATAPSAANQWIAIRRIARVCAYLLPAVEKIRRQQQ